MNDLQLLTVYEWIDRIPLTREKKNMARDFCDGVLTAEIIKHYYPKYVDLHNYPNVSSTRQKLSNWNTLKRKVLKKINFIITEDEVNEIVNAKPKAIEKLLYRLYNFIVKHDKNSISLAKMNAINDSQELNLVKNEISSINKEYEELLKRKDFLENQISVFEKGNLELQKKIQELEKKK